MPIPPMGSCLKLRTSASNVYKGKRMTSITSSMNEFLLFLYYTPTRLHQIRSSNFENAGQPGKHHRHFQRGARTLKNGDYVLMLENMRW
jgi:hypothetical protein